MLTTTKTPTKPVAEASQPQRSSITDLQFLSDNQQLEGFPGKISEDVAAHQPDMKQIAASARNFGAQAPTETNRQQSPIIPRTNR